MFLIKRIKEILSPNTSSKASQLDSFYSSFPSQLHDDVSVVIDVLRKVDKVLNDYVTENKFQILHNQEILTIPYRFYAKQASKGKVKKLTLTQHTILNCIYTRSNNGYLRQKHVEKLLQLETIPKWVFPYIIKLCGEYVVEILQTIDDHFEHIEESSLGEFINENKAFVHLEYCHMVSYWDVSYRYNLVPNLKEFIGFEIFRKRFKYTRAFERFYLESLPIKKQNEENELEIFKKTVDLDQIYFYMPINEDQISTEQLGLKKTLTYDEYIRSSDGSIWREKMLYNNGKGQPKGFERLPSLDFDQLFYIVMSYKSGISHLEEIEDMQNALGSVATIVENHLDELIEFLTVQIKNKNLFENKQYKENLKLFCFDDTKAKGLGGIGQFSYEEILNSRRNWRRISNKVKQKIY